MYQALYRKWRPMTFDDVVSQPHITTTLKNQISSGKTAHAYLFTGSRGTGKTTCARIFAKTINCLAEHDGVPCCECEICKNADNGTLSDIIEIDAASNSKVDDMRDLREGVIYTPEMCKFKVYIIDEVHMLSTGAFNALLKTMEEPPPHVKFILATTEIHKVPATIISRCQHFDFRRIKTEDIVARLLYIASEEKISLQTDAANLIARLSDGGMRDALSLLDQCVAYSDEITMDIVSNAAGIAGRDYLFDIIEKVIDHDTAGAIRIVDDLYGMSKDLKVLCSELTNQMRNCMLIKAIDNNTDLITCLPEELERLKGLAGKVNIDTVLDYLAILQDCSERFSRSSSKRTELEMCIVKLCSNRGRVQSADVSALTAKIAQLENSMVSGQALVNPKANPPEKPAVKATNLKKFDINNYTPLKEWSEILEIIKEKQPSISAFLANSMACIEGDVFNVICASDFYVKKVKNSDDALRLKEIINDYYGKNFGFMLYSSNTVDIVNKENPINELINKAKKADIEVEFKK